MIAGAAAPPTNGTIGRPKVAVARDHVRQVNPWSALAAVAADLADLTPGLFSGLTVVVVAVDNERARYLATRLLLAAGVPHVDAGVRADLWLARATVCVPEEGSPCLVDGWTPEHLARAGENASLPCFGLENAGDFPSTLVMGQAAAALAAHQALALAGVIDEPARVAEELRLDLRRNRLDRFRLRVQPACAADHVLASRPAVRLSVDPDAMSLLELMKYCGVTPDASLVFSAGEVVTTAVCGACFWAKSVFRAARALGLCSECGHPLQPMRRARRVRWAEAAVASAAEPASVWFRPGDMFALETPGAVTVFAFTPPAVPWEPGAPWDETAAAVRFAALPNAFDLVRIRQSRMGIVGLGHLGAAVLQQLAPLPWGGVLLVDRDTFADRNLQAHPLGAEAAGATS